MFKLKVLHISLLDMKPSHIRLLQLRGCVHLRRGHASRACVSALNVRSDKASIDEETIPTVAVIVFTALQEVPGIFPA